MEEKNNYNTIYNIVKDEIIRGIYPTGVLLPTEIILAQKYNVSRPTISKVYNQLQSEGYVNKKKGVGTIVTTGKNAGKILTIGLLLPGAGESEIFSEINEQILQEAEKKQFNCLWDGTTASNADIRKNLIESCCENYIQKGVDGILFSPLERVNDGDDINLRIANMVEQAGIPMVLIDRDFLLMPQRSKFDLVSLDNFRAGSQMAHHLIEKGCKKIIYFYRPNSAYSVNIRLLGIKETAEKNNIQFKSFCELPEDIEAIKRMPIEKGKTGIICANDSTAAVLMTTIEAIGYKIKKDVLISGYDDMKYSKYLKCPLTSYRQPCKEIATTSVELLLQKIKDNSRRELTVYLDGEIVIRESSHFEKK